MKPTDLRQEHVERLGEGFGKVFYAVYDEWVKACVRHQELGVLFGTQETCDLLNAFAPGFFGDVERLFWNDLMLGVTRLTDKSKDAVKVQSFERYIKDDPDLLSAVEEHRKDAVTAAMPVFDWRHRVIAHRNREYATSDSARPLETVQLETCKRVLDHVHSALDAVYRARLGGSLMNSVIQNRPRSGALLAYLKGLVNGVRFVAEIINPEDPDGFDLSKGSEFLAKLGRSEPGDTHRLFDLMDLARSVGGKKRPS